MNVFWIFVSATDVPDKKKTVNTLNLSLLNRRWFLIFGTRPRKIPGNILNCHWLLISWIRPRRRLGNILIWIVAVSDFLNITMKSTRKHFKLSLTPDILYQIENISWWITAGGCGRWRLWVAHSPDCGTSIVCWQVCSFVWNMIHLILGRSFVCLFRRSFLSWFGRSFVCLFVCLEGHLFVVFFKDHLFVFVSKVIWIIVCLFGWSFVCFSF